MLKSGLAAVCLVLTTAAFSDAQVLQFQFAAQKQFGSGEDFGETLSGFLTIDFETPPDTITPYPEYGGEEAFWESGDFSVDVITDSGLMAGTSFEGGRIQAVSRDQPDRPHSLHQVANIYVDDDVFRLVRFYTVDDREPSDGVGDWFDFDPTGNTSGFDEFSIAHVQERNRITGEFRSWYYRVNSFEPIIVNIFIDGVDTGIADFEYDGSLVSELIQNAADSAKNHGKFVSSVAKLTNELKRAGLITDEEKEVLMEVAAESSLGK